MVDAEVCFFTRMEELKEIALVSPDQLHNAKNEIIDEICVVWLGDRKEITDTNELKVMKYKEAIRFKTKKMDRSSG